MMSPMIACSSIAGGIDHDHVARRGDVDRLVDHQVVARRHADGQRGAGEAAAAVHRADRRRGALEAAHVVGEMGGHHLGEGGDELARRGAAAAGRMRKPATVMRALVLLADLDARGLRELAMDRATRSTWPLAGKRS